MRGTTPIRRLVLAAVMIGMTLGVHSAVAATRPWLGVYTQQVTDDLRDGLDLHGAQGVLVNRVVSGSPADDAGIRKGDVILSVNSRSVASPEDLSRLVGDASVGQEVAVTVMRDGDKRTLSAKLGHRSDDDEDMAPPAPPAPPTPSTPPMPPDMATPRERHRDVRVKIERGDGDQNEVHVWKDGKEVDPDQIGDMKIEGLGDLSKLKSLEGMKAFGNFPGMGAMASRGRLGVRIESLNDDLASALGSSGQHGVLVLEVMKDTPAEKAGLRAGDIIAGVEGKDVSSTEELVNALREQTGRTSLRVVRRGSERTVDTELGDAPRVMRYRSNDDEQSGPGRQGDNERHVIRLRDKDQNDADADQLRKQMGELREQIRELRQQLEGMKHD